MIKEKENKCSDSAMNFFHPHLLTKGKNVLARMVPNVSVQMTVSSGALCTNLAHFSLDYFVILVSCASH